MTQNLPSETISRPLGLAKNNAASRRAVREDLSMFAIREIGDPSLVIGQGALDKVGDNGSKSKKMRSIAEMFMGKNGLDGDGINEHDIGCLAFGFAASLARWIRSNLITIRVTPDVIISSSPIAEEAVRSVISGDTRMPFEAFLLEFAPEEDDVYAGWRTEHANHVYTHLLVSAVDYERSSLPIACFPFFPLKSNGRIRAGLNDGSFIFFARPREDQSLEDALAETKDAHLISGTSIDGMTYSPHVISYMMGNGLLKVVDTKKRSSSTMDRRKRHHIIPLVWELDVPAEIDLAGQTRPDAQRASNEEKKPRRPSLRCQHVVRGHWRDQPCGPRLSTVRETWIRPHWRCVDAQYRRSNTADLSGVDK